MFSRARSLVRTLVFGASISVGFSSPTPESATTDAINLNQVTVEVSRDQLIKLKIPRDDWDWSIGHIGDIEFLSSARDKSTKQLATQFYQFTQLVEWMIPAWKRVPTHPLRLVMCGARGSFDTLRPIATENNTRDAVTAYLYDDAGAYIVADLEVQALAVYETHGLRREGGFAGFGEDDDTDSADFPVDTIDYLRRDYVRDLMTSRGIRPPAWLSEGIAQLVATAKIENGKARIGRLTTQTIRTVTNGRTTDSAQISDLSLFFVRRAMMPLLELFAVGYDSPEYLNPIGSTFSGQSLGFVHFCLLGEKGKHQPAFLQWIDRLRRDPPSEDLFRECFGVSTKKFNLALRGYLVGGRYRSAVTKAEPLPKPPSVFLAAAQPVDVACFKANIHRLTGRLDAARQVLATAEGRGFTDAEFYNTLGLTTMAQADYAAAIVAFSTAQKLGSTDPYTRLASIQARVLSQPGLSIVTANELIQSALEIRAELPVPVVTVPSFIAEILLRARLRPDPAFTQLLDQSVRQFPANASLCIAVAKLHQRLGSADLAAEILQRGAAHANDPADRNSLLIAIEQLNPP